MSRAIPWIIAAVCLVAFGASFSEVQRLKARIGDLSDRRLIVRASIAEADQPIVFLGDSITQWAPLPRELCGHPVVNAGIGRMKIREATYLLPVLFDERRAFMIVLAFGANDAGSKSAENDFAELVKTAERSASRLIVVSDTSNPDTNRQIRAASNELPYFEPRLPEGSKMEDGIHLNEVGYANWIPALKSAVESQCRSYEPPS